MEDAAKRAEAGFVQVQTQVTSFMSTYLLYNSMKSTQWFMIYKWQIFVGVDEVYSTFILALMGFQCYFLNFPYPRAIRNSTHIIGYRLKKYPSNFTTIHIWNNFINGCLLLKIASRNYRIRSCIYVFIHLEYIEVKYFI